MDFAEYALHLSPVPNENTVVVNGEDLIKTHRVVGINLLAQAGGVPQLTIDVIGVATVEGQGVVVLRDDVSRAGQEQAVLDFLSQIDPGTLELAALERVGGLEGAESVGGSFLAVLKEMAGGEDGT